MITHYPSYVFKKPIEVANIEGEIIVTITNDNDSESVYSWYDIEEKESYSKYINKCILGGLINEIPKKVLVIGFGGGSFIKFLEDHFLDIEITGIDIEPAMLNICKNILGVKTDNLIINDANIALDDLIEKKEKYDLILFDVYGSDSQIPLDLTKKTFFEKTKKVLKKDGIFSINMSDFEGKNELYKNIHKDLKSLYGEFFSLFKTGKNDIGNCMGIYNLSKNYTTSDFDKNYINFVNNGLALESTEIIKDSFVDEEKKYLK